MNSSLGGELGGLHVGLKKLALVAPGSLPYSCGRWGKGCSC